MTTETVLPANRDSIQAASKANGEPEWLINLRVKALELAGQLELPKLEKTRIDRWQIDAYGANKAAQPVAEATGLPEIAKDLLPENEAGHLIVQHNSGAAYTQISDDLKSQGVIFTDMATAAREHGDLLQQYLHTVVKPEEHRLTALHAAVFQGGIFIHVPKNVRVELPLQALFISDDAEASFSPHVLIVAEQGSEVTYVDNVVSAGLRSELVHNAVVEIVAKPGATVRFASVHRLGKEVTDLSTRRAIVEQDARVEWILGEMNDGNCMSDTTSILKGNGSSSDHKVICVGTGDQKLNITTRAVHFGRQSSSDMITRAVMRDEATAIVNGITKIEKGATDANGEQTERVLMLSPKARGDANPMLLIDEDEVKAGHAASVGQVNKDQLYYMMSRGISKDQATRLIIYGFLAPVVSEIPLESLEKKLSEWVERKLGQ
ncbi:Fe-S cluster assembly protein SufD [Xylanibacillus composti]|uniref:Fe-S cluster assembly protein SufD n=1 Tax=Xylanibacillus composti TaxID=1572762 RepID=A0A8J4M3V2_9BACL|nr:Fe-S cluster assembly protein SufD [Xylanibacillus composti]MDT9724756.1 Fe-S cluster assembly protein SufD [Xylanibacillus composti]GIQ69891.1 Fe-S cluster assembly protein SufD [Xylanibacillus composti]